MDQHFISDPCDDLLQRSGLSPGKVNEELERLASRWQPTVLKPGHPYLRQIRERTGVYVVSIARRYRRLLVEIEQVEHGKLLWRYQERSRTDCVFGCAGVVPDVCDAGLLGGALRALIVPTPAIGAVVIDAIDREPAGRMRLAVTPQWRAF